MIITYKNYCGYSSYNPFATYSRREKHDKITDICEDYAVKISHEAKRLQNQQGEQEPPMHVSINYQYYDNHGATATKTSPPLPVSQPTFDDVLEESSRPEPMPFKNGVSTDDTDATWLPDRLQTLIGLSNPYAGRTMVGGEIIPETFQNISLCPEWYSDLAQTNLDPNEPNYSEMLSEYYSCLKEAMEQALDNNKIRSDEWGKHYDSLISNTTKSEKIHQELLAILKSDPRTLELMDTLGVTSGSMNIKI